MTKAQARALVREADFDDAAAIGFVQVTTWRAAYAGILPQGYLDAMSDIRHAACWAEVLDHPERRGVTMVAEIEEAGIIGFADCGFERGAEDAKKGEVTAIYVLPGHQRSGVGRALIAAGAHALQASGAGELAIWALEKNPARRFYERLGGAVSAKRQVRFYGQELTEVCYRWADIGVLRTE
ncbi:MAG: GNAT family N-acetyltransferase [Alphaproteobacteria bacterium]|nr:GNAT family N-acetyltransferase [Alphaproteobacteria bacterium]